MLKYYKLFLAFVIRDLSDLQELIWNSSKYSLEDKISKYLKISKLQYLVGRLY